MRLTLARFTQIKRVRSSLNVLRVRSHAGCIPKSSGKSPVCRVSRFPHVAVAIDISTVALTDAIVIAVSIAVAVALALTIAIAVFVAVAFALTITVEFSSEVGECHDHLRSFYLLCFRRYLVHTCN